MTKIIKLIFLLFLISSTLHATIWLVPERFPPPYAIQSAISWGEVDNGDTVSVLQGTPENPTIWYENINFFGKNILVVNRDFLGGSNNPATCIIDGQDSGSVVTFNSGETQSSILKGFTIQHGHADYWGGGIFTDSASPTITNNIVKNNRSDWAGGGIACGIYDRRVKNCPIINNNIIIGNYASHFGGGINVELDTVKIINNIITHDTCARNSHGGGGIRLAVCGLGTIVSRNVIDTNYSGGALTGGGILFERCENAKVRNNTVRGNKCDNIFGGGIYCQDSLPDLGTQQDPGFNIIMGNDAKDLYNYVPNRTLMALGNYWGTLDIDTLRAHAGQTTGGNPVDFDPIAASDRVASVSYNSACSTDVIVTGDLTINQNVTLNIAPGQTFKFTSTADTNTGDNTYCELLVNGSLRAIGTETEKIRFTSFPTPPQSPQSGVWYGIRLKPNSIGCFRNCTLQFAYCGIQASANDTLSVDSSYIASNQVYGIKMSRAKSVEIKNSQINSNTYGIYSQFTAPIITNNELLSNTRYGIILTDTIYATISNNHIDGLSQEEPTLYGIEVGRVSDGVRIDSNEIDNWNQGGIYARYVSKAQLNYNNIDNNTYYGILCSDTSNPFIRRCIINNSETGVFCDNRAYPNMGVNNDSGNNSIGMENDYWVENRSADTTRYVDAELNYWGTEDPSEYSEKFYGLVDYRPWLTGPPEGGGQSAGIITTSPRFFLSKPKPNPASKDVKIVYSLPTQGKTELVIYNAMGRIMTKVTEDKSPGLYEYIWNSHDYPNGVYIIRLKANNDIGTQKIVLSK